MLTNAQVIQTKTSQGSAGADFQTDELNRYIQNIPLRQKKMYLSCIIRTFLKIDHILGSKASLNGYKKVK